MTTRLTAALNIAAIAENKQSCSVMATPVCTLQCSLMHSNPIVYTRSE